MISTVRCNKNFYGAKLFRIFEIFWREAFFNVGDDVVDLDLLHLGFVDQELFHLE